MRLIPHIKLFTSTKATLLEDRIEAEMKKLQDNDYIIDCVTSNISFAGKEGYMILAQLDYHEEVMDDDIQIGFDIGSDTGMSFDCPSTEVPEA